MKTTSPRYGVLWRSIWHVLAVLAFALAAVALFAPNLAWAAPTVKGVDFTSADTLNLGGAGEASVPVVEVSGAQGETVFATVKDGDAIIAKNLAYTLGEGENDGQAQAESWHGIVSLDIDGFDAAKLEIGAYHVMVHADRTGNTPLYDGAVYGAYADLDGDGTGDRLIGVRTISDAESGRTFNPPPTLYVGDDAYSTDGTPLNDGPAYVYAYVAAEASAEGTVRYVYYDDANACHEILTETHAFAGAGTHEMAVKDVLEDAEGNRYRSIFSQDSVTLRNPGALSFTIYCARISRDTVTDYTATIKMVCGDEIVARDMVDVKGAYTYTAPSAIYRTEEVDGVDAVTTFTLQDDAVIDLTKRPDDDVFVVNYRREDPESAAVAVTFNQLDGTRAPGSSGRVIGTQRVTVDNANQTATPDATISANGAAYDIAGSPEGYAYRYRSGALPVIDVYYVPEGYEPDGPYKVTVRYVNYANNAVLGTERFTSSPDDQGARVLDTAARFQDGGETYVRLEGQARLQHSYYSGVKTYTVYYRNAADSLDASIGHVRVVYDRTSAANAVGSTGSSAQSASSSGQSASEANDARLKEDRDYATVGGENGNGTLTNEDGVDSATERITDDDTPLAQEAGQTQTPSENGGGAGVWAAVLAAIAAAAGLAVFLVRKRRNDDPVQA